METNISTSRLNSDLRSQKLIEYLKSIEQRCDILEGVIYYDFPLFRDVEDVLYRSKVLLASRSHGLVIFSVPELAGRSSDQDLDVASAELEQLYSIIYGKLLGNRVLRESARNLKFPVMSFIYLPDVDTSVVGESIDINMIFSLGSIDKELRRVKLYAPLNHDEWAELRASVEGAKGIFKAKSRDVAGTPLRSKGRLLQKLEAEIANFDKSQRLVAMTLLDGPQRIRGLAGSGKTVVLAMKAAHIHLDDPEAEILITFWTKSLYSIIRRLITRFYRQFNDQDPNWDKVHIRHAWGGQNLRGVYSDACISAGYKPEIFSRNNPKSTFKNFCSNLISTKQVRQNYDYILIDEAQDLPDSFMKLCFELARGGMFDRNIVWAYDDLQNIMNVTSKSPSELFGSYSSGEARIDLDRVSRGASFSFNHDVVLHKCYRNPREVLVVAHALGFGIYSDTVVQILENKAHWEDVGYSVEVGDCIPGEFTVICRPIENSPLTLAEAEPREDLLLCRSFDTLDEECRWVCSEISSMVGEGLRPDDILVVSLDDYNARSYFQEIGMGLRAIGIGSNALIATPGSAPEFAVEDCVTLTTVYRAKGNEAAAVFAVGIDALYLERKSLRARNKIFTAFTRAKAWLRVSGLRVEAQHFLSEIELALAKCPRMEFIYPDPRAVHINQRDLKDKSAKMTGLTEVIREEAAKLGLSDLTDEEIADIMGQMRDRKKS